MTRLKRAHLGVNEFLKVCWAFREHDLACRPNVRLEEVAAMRSTVLLANYGMCVVDDWLTLINATSPIRERSLTCSSRVTDGSYLLLSQLNPAQA